MRVGVIVVGELGAIKAEQELVRGNPNGIVRGPTLSHDASNHHHVAKVSLKLHFSLLLFEHGFKSISLLNTIHKLILIINRT